MHLIWLSFISLVSTTSSTKTSNPLNAANKFRFQITEELPIGSLVADMKEESRFISRYTSHELSQLEFRILTSPALPFAVELTSGKIVTEGSIDRDSLMQCKDKELCQVQLDITVKPTKFFELLKVVIEIADINDNAPYFKESSINLSIRESIAVGSTLQLPAASDLDSPRFAVKSYLLVDYEISHFGLSLFERKDFMLDPRLVVLSALDRETKDKYEMKLVASDGGLPPLSATLDILVHVADANDNSPRFEFSTYEVNVTEDIKPGTVILNVLATDKDSGLNGQVVYRFSDQTMEFSGTSFELERRTGSIKVIKNLDRETQASHQLTVFAEDLGPDSVPVDTTVLIRVIDVNDNKPIITISTFTTRIADFAEVWENQPPNTFVAHITVEDLDDGINGQVKCHCSSQNFVMHQRYSTQYQLMTTEVLDREKADAYKVRIICSDMGEPQMTSRKELDVIVKNVNDNAPQFSKKSYSIKVLENNQRGQHLLRVHATDADGDENLVFSSSAIDLLRIDAEGNMVILKVIDKETVDKFELQLFVRDSGNPALTGTSLLTIEVGDLNDERPTFFSDNTSFNLSQWFSANPNPGEKNNRIFQSENLPFFFQVPENEPPGSYVGKVVAYDQDKTEPNNLVKYFLVLNNYELLTARNFSNSFKISSETGVITTRFSLDREARNVHKFFIQAVDLGTPPMSSTVEVLVRILDKNDNYPYFEPPLKSFEFHPHLPQIPSNDGSVADSDVHTIFVNPLTPSHSVVTQANAKDADEGSNARVTYSIESGDGGYFHMDEQSGNIVVASSMSSINHEVFSLVLLAKDDGEPVLLSRAALKIVVNNTVPPLNLSDRQADQVKGLNAVWMVIIIALSTSTIIVLCVVLSVVYRQNVKRQKRLRLENREKALKILTSKEDFQQIPETEKSGLPSILKKKTNMSLASSTDCAQHLLTSSFLASPSAVQAHSLPKTSQKYRFERTPVHQHFPSAIFRRDVSSKGASSVTKWTKEDDCTEVSGGSKGLVTPISQQIFSNPHQSGLCRQDELECVEFCTTPSPNSPSDFVKANNRAEKLRGRSCTISTPKNQPCPFRVQMFDQPTSKKFVGYENNFCRTSLPRSGKMLLSRISEHPV